MGRGGRVLQHACTHPDLHKHTTSQYLLILPPPQTFLRSFKPADLTLEEAGSRLRQALDKVRAWIMLSSCHICVPVSLFAFCSILSPCHSTHHPIKQLCTQPNLTPIKLSSPSYSSLPLTLFSPKLHHITCYHIIMF